MATAKHACPICGSIDVVLESELVVTGDRTAYCPLCDWRGLARETVGFATTEVVWDIERISMVALRIVTKHATGPLMQFWEFIGLTPKMIPITREVTGPRRRKAEAHNKKVEEARSEIMRATLAATLEAAFLATAAQRDRFPELYGSDEKEKTMPDENEDQVEEQEEQQDDMDSNDESYETESDADSTEDNSDDFDGDDSTPEESESPDDTNDEGGDDFESEEEPSEEPDSDASEESSDEGESED